MLTKSGVLAVLIPTVLLLISIIVPHPAVAEDETQSRESVEKELNGFVNESLDFFHSLPKEKVKEFGEIINDDNSTSLMVRMREYASGLPKDTQKVIAALNKSGVCDGARVSEAGPPPPRPDQGQAADSMNADPSFIIK